MNTSRSVMAILIVALLAWVVRPSAAGASAFPVPTAEPDPPHAEASEAGERCVVLADVSGSTTDDEATRAWFAEQLSALLSAYNSVALLTDIVVLAYAEGIQLVHPSQANPIADSPLSIVAAVESSMRTKEWTDPLPAFRLAAETNAASCVLNLTDGSLDLPPNLAADPAAHLAQVLSVADVLRDRGIPVLTIALSDDNGGLWREVGERTGGAYLVDPTAPDLQRELSSMLNRLQLTPATATIEISGSPSSSATPEPRQTPRTSGPAGAPPSAGSTAANGTSVTAVVASVIVATIASLAVLAVILAVVASRRPRLTGCLVLLGPGGEVAVDLSGFRGSVTVGSHGDVEVHGDGVERQHARLASAFDDVTELVYTVVHPVNGELWIGRDGRIFPVQGELILEDNDRLIMGRVEARFSLLFPGFG